MVGGVLYGPIYGVVFPALGFPGTIKAFVAAVVGGIGNLGGALIAGLLLGVIETLVVVYSAQFFGMPTGYRDAAAFVLLIVFLLFKPTGRMGTRVSMSEVGLIASMGYSSVVKKTVDILGLATVPRSVLAPPVLVAAILLPQVIGNEYYLWILTIIMMYSIAVLGMNLVLGYCGQFHFGQAGFMAIGAYTTALLLLNTEVNFIVALAASGALALIAGLLVGTPALRVRSDYLGLVTFAFGEIVRLVIVNSEFTRGPLGLPGIPQPALFGFKITSTADLYYYALFLLVLAYVLWAQVTRSYVGRAWRAIYEDETAAEAMGVNTGRYKIFAFGLACFLGGLAGAFWATQLRIVTPALFELDLSVMVIIMLVLGGMGSLPGSIIGATEMLRPPADFCSAFIGLVMILVPIYRPQGLFVRLGQTFARAVARLRPADGVAGGKP